MNKSLVMLEDAAPDEEHGRYQLLETMRQYAQERLVAEGEVSQARHRHIVYYLALTERAEPELTGTGQLHWLDRLEREHDNLCAALAWRVERSAHAQ